jgi:hypothetical protein
MPTSGLSAHNVRRLPAGVRRDVTSGVPLVLTLSFRSREKSPRWKEIVEAASGRFTHHLELVTTADIDDEVRGWLRDAYDAAM